MLEGGARMRTEKVDVWLDAGTPETVLETNRYLLEHGRDNTEQACQRQGVTIIPPVFIHETAQIEVVRDWPVCFHRPGMRAEAGHR